jgi:hypothetical protein
LSDTTPPSFTTYTQGANYEAGDCVLWHLAGAGYQLYTANEVITGAPQYLDPVKWTLYEMGDIVERRFVQGWTDSDLLIGDQILDGDYDGKYVTEVIVPGGNFEGIEGGNRPTFVSGGRQEGRIINITGSFYALDNYKIYTGAFRDGNVESPLVGVPGGAGGYNYRKQVMDAARVVPIGPDVASANLSIRLWRRVS